MLHGESEEAFFTVFICPSSAHKSLFYGSVRFFRRFSSQKFKKNQEKYIKMWIGMDKRAAILVVLCLILVLTVGCLSEDNKEIQNTDVQPSAVKGETSTALQSETKNPTSTTLGNSGEIVGEESPSTEQQNRGILPTSSTKKVEKSTVEKVIQEYLGQTAAQVSSDETKELELAVTDYKLEPPSGLEPVLVPSPASGGELEFKPVINTRDWAYAAKGIEYTFLGGLVDGQEDKLDMGLYSFLQAAALNPDEPEHLSNVAFHLNNKGDYDQSFIILSYALSINEDYVPARSNLAYAYAGQGDYTKAVLEQLRVVSLRPEKWYLQRLAEYYEGAGMPEAAKAINDALEGSQEPAMPSFPPVLTLSSKGENVLEEIERLEEELTEEEQRISDSKASPLEEILDGFLAEWANIVETTFTTCPWDVAMGGGDAYAICVSCYVPGAQKTNSLVSSFYQDVMPAVHSFESDAFRALEKYTRQAVSTVEGADLDESEKQKLLKAVHRRFTVEHTKRILGPRSTVKRTWNQWQAEYRAGMAEGCGEAPVGDIKVMEEEDAMCRIFPIACQKWSIWFVIGEMSYDPAGTFDISFGQGLSLKYRYNFAKDITSLGVGLGVNLDHVIGAGGTLFFNPTEGVTTDLKVDFSPPVGIVANLPTDIHLTQLAAFMN